MGRSPTNTTLENNVLKKGPWTPEEDQKLIHYIHKHGPGNWKLIPRKAGINRCGKSCRLRWTNYLRPDIKRGNFSPEEDQIIINLHSSHGNKWARIASCLPRRTDNEIKNYWNTRIRKRLIRAANVYPYTQQAIPDLSLLRNLIVNPLESMVMMQIVQNMLGILSTTNIPYPNFHGATETLMNQFNRPLGVMTNPGLIQTMSPNVEVGDPTVDKRSSLPEAQEGPGVYSLNQGNSGSSAEAENHTPFVSDWDASEAMNGDEVDSFWRVLLDESFREK